MLYVCMDAREGFIHTKHPIGGMDFSVFFLPILSLAWTWPGFPLLLSFLLSISPAKTNSHACRTPAPFSHCASCDVLRSVMDDANDNGGAEVLSLVLVVSSPWLVEKSFSIPRIMENGRGEEGAGTWT